MTAVTLTLNAVIQFFHRTLAYDAVLSNYVLLQMEQQFRRYCRNSHILLIQALAVTLTLNVVNQCFRMTHRLVIMHHHAKSGLKKMIERFRRYFYFFDSS